MVAREKGIDVHCEMGGKGDGVDQRNHSYAIWCLSDHELDGGVGVIVNVAAAFSRVQALEKAWA